jgi:hypothetical protein
LNKSGINHSLKAFKFGKYLNPSTEVMSIILDKFKLLQTSLSLYFRDKFYNGWDRPQVFYMPLWTETELETIAPYFPADIDWHNRFKILGGIPRYVLEDTEDHMATRRVFNRI